jgi:hypothetical protein
MGLADGLDRKAPGLLGCLELLRTGRGDIVESSGGKSQELHDGAHGVRRELPTAGSWSGTHAVLERQDVRVGQLTLVVRAQRLEECEQTDRLAIQASRQDRAAVEDEAGKVRAAQRHHRGGVGLIAGGEATHEPVEAVTARDQLDRVGD